MLVFIKELMTFLPALPPVLGHRTKDIHILTCHLGLGREITADYSLHAEKVPDGTTKAPNIDENESASFGSKHASEERNAKGVWQSSPRRRVVAGEKASPKSPSMICVSSSVKSSALLNNGIDKTASGGILVGRGRPSRWVIGTVSGSPYSFRSYSIKSLSKAGGILTSTLRR